MDASDQAAILKMMDEEDGVSHRRVRKVTSTAAAGNNASGGNPSGKPGSGLPKISSTSSTGSTTTVILRKDPSVRFQNPLLRKNKSESIEESSAERH